MVAMVPQLEQTTKTDSGCLDLYVWILKHLSVYIGKFTVYKML